MVVALSPDRYVTRLGNPASLEAAVAAAESSVTPHAVADFFRRRGLVLNNKDYRAQFFRNISPDGLAALIRNPPLANDWLEALASMRLLPTPEILSFALSNGKEAKEKLEMARQEIWLGGFNPANPLHVELEYSHYVGESGLNYDGNMSSCVGSLSLSQFAELPMAETTKVRLGGEGKRLFFDYADRTADEALAVFHLIMSKVDKDVPLLVIGNKRYGSMFVTDTIKPYLARGGVKIVNNHLHSIDFDGSNVLGDNPVRRIGRLSDDILEHIARQSPNVVVVDGTKACWEDNMTRFPAAMIGYINAFMAYNEACGIKSGIDLSDREQQSQVSRMKRFNPQRGYRIGFWAPGITEEFVVGAYRRRPSDYALATGSQTRELTIVSSTGRHGSGGAFDDPEDEAKRMVVCFTPYGIGQRKLCDSEADLVSAVQERMNARIAEQLG